MEGAKWQVSAEMLQSQFQIGKYAASGLRASFRIAENRELTDEKRVYPD
jgi:hypothetical protein